MQRIGGSFDHWESTSDAYRAECGTELTYVSKPKGYELSIDYSFAFIIDIAKASVRYGYYYNPKGPSGDGWNWE